MSLGSRRLAGVIVTFSLLAFGSGVAVAADTDASVIDAAKKYVAPVMAPPTAWPGPTSSPKPATGKKITIISCAQASACAIDAAAALEAAKVMGWDASVIDGKGDPAVYNASLRSAVNSGSAGIIDIAMPTNLVQDGLRYAHDHKVPVVNAADIVSPDPLVFGNVQHQWIDQGIMLGQWLVANSDGKAGVVILRDDEFPGIKLREDNVAAVLKTCAGCADLEEVGLTIGQAVNPATMGQQTQSLIARFGDKMKYIVSPFGTVDGLVAPALRAHNRSDVKIVGYDGSEQQVQMCHDGAVGAIAVTMLAWTGWGAVDQLNRALQSQPSVDEKVPAFLATTATCGTSGLAEDASKFDFKAKYRELWGK